MGDFGFYWKNFARESKAGDWPAVRWFTGSEQLANRIRAGDRLWLFTSGEACGMADSRSGYLVEVFRVREVAPNIGGSADYTPAEFAYTIHGEDSRCVAVNPPLLVDRIIRPAETDESLGIGRVRQRPWQLSDEAVAALLAELRAERPDLASFVEP